MTLASVDLGPNVRVPEHHHENEQLGIVIQGSVTFTIGAESRVLGPGETYVIPSHVPITSSPGRRAARCSTCSRPSAATGKS